MPKICLLALIGLPGAGKTRLSNWLLEHQSVLDVWNVIHLCYDDYFDMQSISKDFYKEQRHLIFELLIDLVKTLRSEDSNPKLPDKIRRAATFTNNGNYLIICDDNHYYRSMRYKIYQLCRLQGCIYAQIFIAADLTACLLANEHRSPKEAVPETVIRKMLSRLEPPTNMDSNAWECNSLLLDHTDFNLTSHLIGDFIKSLLNRKMEVEFSLVRAEMPQIQSLTHQLDLQLRARIQAQMHLPNHTESKQDRSLALNERRKDILAQFRREMSCKQTNIDSVHLEYYINLLN